MVGSANGRFCRGIVRLGEEGGVLFSSAAARASMCKDLTAFAAVMGCSGRSADGALQW